MTTTNEAMAMICASTIRPQIKAETDVVERLRKAFRIAQDFFMSSDDEVRLRGALAAVVLESNEVDADRIAKTMAVLNALAANVRGVPVDMAAAMSQMEGIEPLPIRALWLDAKAVAR